MTYDELTADQKAEVQALANLARPLAGELARLLEKFQAVVAGYVGNTENVLGLLGASDLVPNTSGLTGAESLTKEQMINLIGYMITASATADGASGSYNTNYHRALYALACGPGNLIVG
jgi:hypothetical protein